MTDTKKKNELATSADLDLRSIIVDRKASSDEHQLSAKTNKLKKQYALMMATAETEKENLKEKFIDVCGQKEFSLATLINIKDEMDLLDRRMKVANEIYFQLIGKE